MLREHDVPDFIVEAILTNLDNPNEQERNERNYLYGCGRALSFVRMASSALEDLHNEESFGGSQKVAEYHAFMGVCGSRTAIDAAANWVRTHYRVPVTKQSEIDLAKEGFQKKLAQLQEWPKIEPYVQKLAELATQIDPERQRAVHREGLALLHYDKSGWYLTKGLQAPRDKDEHCAALLRKWADDIQEQVHSITRVLYS